MSVDGFEEGSKAEELHEKAQAMFEDESSIYLSGPIRCVEDNGVPWRDNLINDYPEYDFLNPLDNYSPDEDDILNDPVDLDPESDRRQVIPEDYVSQDKLMIDRCDYFFLGLPNEIARGSLMEAMYAHSQGVPIFVWNMEGQEESGWVRFHSEIISPDRDEVMNELINCE